VRAEELGFDTAYIDGDISQLSERARPSARRLDRDHRRSSRARADPDRSRSASSSTGTPAHLAQVIATAERIAPGRSPLLRVDRRPSRTIARGGCRSCPRASASDWLEETLDAVRAAVARRVRHAQRAGS
jgi:hypothetical protein